MEVTKILTLYRQASGHEVNVDKSSILFSKNTNVVDENMAKGMLDIQRSMEKAHYLGLPLLFGRIKASELRNIKERLWTRI